MMPQAKSRLWMTVQKTNVDQMTLIRNRYKKFMLGVKIFRNNRLDPRVEAVTINEVRKFIKRLKQLEVQVTMEWQTV